MSNINRRQMLGAAGLGLAALPLAANSAAAAGPATGAPSAGAPVPQPQRAVTTGAERLARSGWAALSGQRVGVVTNPTGILDDLTHVVTRW